MSDLFEFWFRKEYKQLILDKSLVKFVRPGIRLYPEPKGTKIGDKVSIRILDVPGTETSEYVLNSYIAPAVVTELKIKRIDEMDANDFEGASPDADSQEKILTHLERIYQKKFTKNDTVTVFKIDYL